MNLRALAVAAILPLAAPAEPVAVPVPAAALPVPGAVLPTPTEAAFDALSILAWPLQLKFSDAVLFGGAAIGTIGLLGADTRLYRNVHRVKWTLHRKSIFNYTLLAGDGIMDLGVLGAFALGGERGRRTAVAGIEALLSVAATSTLMKHVFRVQRPQADATQKGYFGHFGDDAFPSGHTMSAFATATVIDAEYPTAGPFAYGVATLVGLSVMKRGWHWPSDVLAGAALGTLIGRVALRVNRRHISVAPVPGGIGLQTDL